MEIKETTRALLQHLQDNDGDMVYWGEKRPPRPQTSVQGAVDVVRATGQEGDKAHQLKYLLETTIGNCQRCPLGATRIKLVFGVGNPDTEVMFVGEGPGYDEDRQGAPFVGKAGQLLDKIISAIGLDRTRVYIANVVKCHPMVDPRQPDKRGNDRPPSLEEMEMCLPYLKEQIRIISPKIIITLGATATKALLLRREGISSLRGRLFDFYLSENSTPIKILPTFHPAALLRDENLKRPVWDDMKLLRSFLQPSN